MRDSLFLKELKIHSDWLPFLCEDILHTVATVETDVCKKDFTPSSGRVLRFFTLPLSSAKIVILGQDPYPQAGVATGRAFEVGTLQSWNQPFQNVSLKNILRSLYKAYTGSIITFSQLRERIYSDFPVLPPYQIFTHWENQGVLLLNTSYTCEQGKPGSHKALWEDFSHRLLSYIAEKAPHITWFIWGNHAAQAIKETGVRNVIATMHPMMCYDSPGRSKDFLYGKNNCFEPFNAEIDWTGYAFNRQKKKQGLLF